MQMFNIEMFRVDSKGITPPHQITLNDQTANALQLFIRAYTNRERYSEFGISQGYDILVLGAYM